MWLHLTSVFLAYAVVGFGYLFPSKTTNIDTQKIITIWVVLILSAFGSITGFALMIGRKGKSESIVLAVSTIAIVLLLFLVL
jgi:hypothetical protein